ncbi:MAG: tRNA (N(6)-L-threonylcarbamoyladenosine(37)-C(2))-methylthiotransferase MtaB, partial [Epsilonproteobacteria bacterium]|nr:tRNA (N(6)-L-threonylcarbamoyladenosine(37)-C(2))-methylthiotransferase MtaB [Campylobacterota bacterium]NPA63662.1 tRNA (N(6)-L-threonylcarbamoyladenosine(37)-C(2))-methylthiotransferase MtaB [Campylobacterota bacterium]
EIFKEALENLQKFPLTHIHLFTYSKRDGTPAADMKPQVPGDVAKRRYRAIKQSVEDKNLLFRKKLRPLEVLVESKKGEYYFGHDQFFNPVFIRSDLDLAGNWVYIEEYEAKKEGNFAKFA